MGCLFIFCLLTAFEFGFGRLSSLSIEVSELFSSRSKTMSLSGQTICID